MRTSGYLMYTAGQLGVMMLTRYFFQWIIRFTEGDGTTVALLSAGAMALILPCFRAFDAVIDPVIGAAGDAWVRSGRQRRKLLWLALPWPAIGLGLIFAPSVEMLPALRWALFALGMFLFFAGYSFYAIPFWSLIGDYAQGDEAVRTRLSNAQGVGLLLATAVGFILSPLAVAHWGFGGGAIVFGLASLVLMTLPYFAAPPGFSGTKVAVDLAKLSPWSAMARAFRDKRFLGVIVLFTGAQMSFTIMTSAAPFIAEKLLGGTIKDTALLLGPFLLSTLVFFSFVRKWSSRFGWERVVLFGTVALGVAYGGAGFLGQAIIGTPFTTAMCVFAAAGPGAAVILGLEAEAVVRCASEAEHESTGSYFGLFNMVVQGSNGLALTLATMLADASRTSPFAIRAMPMVAGVLCVLSVVLYLGFFEKHASAPPGAAV